MNGSYAAVCVNNNKSIRVHSRGNFERMDRLLYPSLIMKNLINYENFLFHVYCQKIKHLDCLRIFQNILKYRIFTVLHVGGNYYIPVTKSYIRENNQIHLCESEKKSLMYGSCFSLKSCF